MGAVPGASSVIGSPAQTIQERDQISLFICTQIERLNERILVWMVAAASIIERNYFLKRIEEGRCAYTGLYSRGHVGWVYGNLPLSISCLVM